MHVWLGGAAGSRGCLKPLRIHQGLSQRETSQMPHGVALSLAAVRWGWDYKQPPADKALEE